MTLATKIRNFFAELFASSYVIRLEIDLSQLRQDFSERLLDKEAQVEEYRRRVVLLEAENARMRQVLLPMSTPAGAAYGELIYPTEQRAPVVIPPRTNWRNYMEEQMKMQDEAEAAAKEKEKEQVNKDGV